MENQEWLDSANKEADQVEFLIKFFKVYHKVLSNDIDSNADGIEELDKTKFDQLVEDMNNQEGLFEQA